MRGARFPRSPLQALRVRAGLRQDELAAQLEPLAASLGKCRVITAQTVCDWEAGRRLTLDTVVLLCAYWRRSAEDLGLIPAFAAEEPRTVDPPHAGTADLIDVEPEEDDPMDRRRFIGHLAAVTVGGSLCADARWLPGPTQPTPAPTRVGVSDLAHLEATTQALRELDHAFGGGACRDALEAQVGWARQLLRLPAAGKARQRLLVAVADLHNLAGWTAFDVGLWNPARRHFLAALELAQEARAHSLVADVLYRTGRLHLHHGWAPEALRLFQLGQIAAHDAGSPRSVAVLSANEGWAYATLGRADQALTSLRRAEDAFACGHHSDVPGWVRFFGVADLAAMAGTIHTELPATRRASADCAIAALTASLDQRGDGGNRSRAFELTMLATNHLRHGDPAIGAALADEALVLAAELRSSRVIDRLAPLREAAAAHRHRSDLRDVGRRITALVQ